MGAHTFVRNFTKKVVKVQGTWFRARGTGCMVSRVRSTWFQEYGYIVSKGTGVQGKGYIVSHYPITHFLRQLPSGRVKLIVINIYYMMIYVLLESPAF